MLPLSVGVSPAGGKTGVNLRQCVEVARTVPLGYQPTQLPGGTMTPPEGAILPFNPLTPCMTVHVYTFVCKLDAGVHGYKTKNNLGLA